MLTAQIPPNIYALYHNEVKLGYNRGFDAWFKENYPEGRLEYI